MTTHLTVAQLAEATERDLGTTAWRPITQEQIDGFADATGDRQWIHVDPAAAAEGPFGQTIAHGYLTLSLLPVLVEELLVVRDQSMGVNYGIDRLRFTQPVPSGSRVRLRAKLLGGERRENGVLYRIAAEIEIEGRERPALVGEVVYLAVP